MKLWKFFHDRSSPRASDDVQLTAVTVTGSSPSPNDTMDEDSSDKKGRVVRPKSSLSSRKILLGVPIVVGIAFTWVGATQTGKSTYTATFHAPFFNVWFSTVFIFVCYPVYALTLTVFFGKSFAETWRSSYSVLRNFTLPGYKHILHEDGTRYSLVRFFTVQSLVVVGPFCALWMATNYCYLRALASIAPTDVTALFSSAPAFVYLFSHLFLKEKFVLLRPLAVVVAIAGIVLFAYADGFKAATAEGTSLSVAAAIGAGLYKSLFKRAVGDATLGQVSFFMSTLSVISTLLLWPVCLALHFAGVEVLHHLPWRFLLPNAALGLLFNFLINFGIAFTYPLFISLGTVLGIPVNAVADYVFRGIVISTLKYISAAYILTAFAFMVVSPRASEYVKAGLMTVLWWKNSDLEEPKEDESQ